MWDLPSAACSDMPSWLYWIQHLSEHSLPQLELSISFFMAAAWWAPAQCTQLCFVHGTAILAAEIQTSAPQAWFYNKLYKCQCWWRWWKDIGLLFWWTWEQTMQHQWATLPWVLCIPVMTWGRKCSQGRKYEGWGMPMVSACFLASVEEVRNSLTCAAAT